MPTVTLQPLLNQGHDTYISTENPDTSYQSDPYMMVGSADDPNNVVSDFKFESLIKFDLSSINGVVKEADMNFRVGSYQEGNSIRVDLHEVTDIWSNPTWNTKPSYSTEVLGSVLYTHNPSEGFPEQLQYSKGILANTVVPLLNDWINGTKTNNGFLLKDDGSAAYKLWLKSSNYNYDPIPDIDYPRLRLTYNEVPSSPGTITSPLSGVRWTGNQIVRWGAATDSDTPSSELQYEGEISYDNGVSWNPMFSLTGQGITEKQIDFTQFAESNQAKVRVRAYDGELYGNWQTSDAFIINHNLSPNAPSKLNPGNGKVISMTDANRFTWQHNDINGDPQQSYDLYYRLQGAGTWNTVSGTTIDQYHDFPANTFTDGVWEWKVVTYDEEFASPDSAIAIFEARQKPDSPAFTNPTNNEILITAQPTITWTSANQTGYELKVKQNGNTVWFVNEDGTNTSRQIDYSLSDNSTYTFELRVKNAHGLLSDVSSITIQTDYIEPPQPIVDVSEGNGLIVIEIDNPNPAGEQPTLLHNDVYKKIDGEWVRIATNIPFDGVFRDYEVASGKTYEYKVRARGDNLTYVDSETGSASTKLRGVWLHEVTDPEQTIEQFRVDGGGRNSSDEIASALMNFKGRKHPVMETEESYNYVINFNLTLINEADRERLERLVYSRNILCYRDGRGRISYGILTILPLSDEAWGGQTTSLQLTRIDYQEGV